MKIILLALLSSIMSVASAQNYNRDEWKFGSKKINCKNTRTLVLEKESSVPVTYTKRKDNKKCSVATGKWEDFYYKETHTLASNVDVDHVVPLKHAHDSGGNKWSSKKKEEFANDPLNLVLTNKKYNRQKGAKTPLEWMPFDRIYACKYMHRWMEVKNKYALEISKKETDHLSLLKCN